MKIRILPFFTAVISTILLSACSSIPENLASDDPSLVTDFTQWDAEQSHPVRLGGVIAKVTNLKQQTRIEIVNLPIGSSGKPDIKSEPKGRYVAYVDGFADPVSLAEGRLITTFGTSSGTEEGTIGDYEYTFPVMKHSQFHLWRIEERVRVEEYGSYVFPCRGFHCRHSQIGPREGKVIQEVK